MPCNSAKSAHVYKQYKLGTQVVWNIIIYAITDREIERPSTKKAAAFLVKVALATSVPLSSRNVLLEMSKCSSRNVLLVLELNVLLEMSKCSSRHVLLEMSKCSFRNVFDLARGKITLHDIVL